MVRPDGEKYYYTQNQQYSITGLVDKNGALVQRYFYSPYGKTMVEPVNGQTEVKQPYAFTGQRYDSETGLYNFKARVYNANLQRFVQRDPSGYVDGWNLYANYFNVNGTDPYGRWKKKYLGKPGSHIWQSEKGDTLWSLAAKSIYGGNGENWRCLWPDKGTKNHGYPRKIHICDEYDASNLAVPATSNLVSVEVADEYLHARYWNATQFSTTAAVVNHIKTRSGEGKTPITRLIAAGHGAHGFHVIGPENSTVSDLGAFHIVQAAISGNPTFDQVKSKRGPIRCWFSRDARVWGAACKTSMYWAHDMANSVLRKGAVAYGTSDFLFSFLSLASRIGNGTWYFKYQSLLNDSGWAPHSGKL